MLWFERFRLENGPLSSLTIREYGKEHYTFTEQNIVAKFKTREEMIRKVKQEASLPSPNGAKC